jgi:hypothetical protein
VRAQLTLFAIVVALVAVLAVMPKSRAAGDIADGANDVTSAPVADAESTAGDETLCKPSTKPEITVSSDDTERLIEAVYQQDDSRAWDKGITWAGLKQPPSNPGYSYYSGFAPAVYCVSDITTHPFGSSDRDRMLAGKAYLDAARKLDDVANDLEEAKLFRDADKVREITGKLRTRARAFPSETAERPKGDFTYNGFLLAR